MFAIVLFLVSIVVLALLFIGLEFNLLDSISPVAIQMVSSFAVAIVGSTAISWTLTMMFINAMGTVFVPQHITLGIAVVAFAMGYGAYLVLTSYLSGRLVHTKYYNKMHGAVI